MLAIEGAAGENRRMSEENEGLWKENKGLKLDLDEALSGMELAEAAKLLDEEAKQKNVFRKIGALFPRR